MFRLVWMACENVSPLPANLDSTWRLALIVPNGSGSPASFLVRYTREACRSAAQRHRDDPAILSDRIVARGFQRTRHAFAAVGPDFRSSSNRLPREAAAQSQRTVG